jgi:phosphoserine phosphatase
MSFEHICFDCDSTLTYIEGIDELAQRVGLGPQLAKLTDAAMNGDEPLEVIYRQRMALIQPDRTAIDWLAQRYIAELVPGVMDVFESLRAHDKTVYMISGGIRPALLPLAVLLGIPAQNVYAVDLFFDELDRYSGYDEKSPLVKNGGKAFVVQSLQAESVVMIGDGKTDIEVQQLGVKVIGFGGVVSRDIVREKADFFVEETNLKAVLNYIL